MTTDAENSRQVRDDIQEASALSSWHSLRYLCLFSLAPFFRAPTVQEVCTISALSVYTCLCVCVGVLVIQEERAKTFFYTQPQL